jgi:Transthyretin-like family
MSKRTEFSTDEIFRIIDTSLEQTDRLRANNLDKMATVQQVNTKALEKERERLSVKYGANDARVQRIDTKLQFTQGFTRDLKVEIDKTKIQVPTVDRNTWMVHGRVLQAKDNQGIPGLTVSLVNRKGQWIRDLGYACTDERGYFAILYWPKDDKSATKPPTEPVFLMVSDPNQRILYRSSEALTIQLGQVVYREIFLSDTDVVKICVTPPDVNSTDVMVDVMVEPDVWLARGRVSDEQGQPLEGLVVSLYDRDLIFDDRLGTTQTDANGDFSIAYRTEDFRDLFEAHPDLYIKVMDSQGNTLYSSENAVRCETGRVEVFNITINRRMIS